MNDGISKDENQEAYNATGAEIKEYVERVRSLNDDIKELREQIKEIYEEASSTGLDKKALKSLVKIANSNKEKLAHEETLLQIYRDATGI